MNYLYFHKGKEQFLAPDSEHSPEGARFIAYVHGNCGPGLAFANWYRATYPNANCLSVSVSPQDDGTWKLEVGSN